MRVDVDRKMEVPCGKGNDKSYLSSASVVFQMIVVMLFTRLGLKAKKRRKEESKSKRREAGIRKEGKE